MCSAVYDPNENPDYTQTARFNLIDGWVAADLVKGRECTLAELRDYKAVSSAEWKKQLQAVPSFMQPTKTSVRRVVPEDLEGAVKVYMRVYNRGLYFKVGESGSWRKACNGESSCCSTFHRVVVLTLALLLVCRVFGHANERSATD